MRRTAKVEKKRCSRCHKNREVRFYEPRARICEFCKDVDTRVEIELKERTPLPKLKNDLQKIVNKYIRLRDKDLSCISCGGPVQHAGHYWSVGANSALRFNTDNINGQCDNCNRWKSGNLLEYRIALVKKIGLERVEWLDQHRKDKHKYTREELAELKDKFEQMIGEWND